MPTQRIQVSGDAYVFTDQPVSSSGVSFGDALASLPRGAAGALPAAVTWDLRLHARLGEAVVRLGDGPLDDLLLSQVDARGGCAVLESTLERLRARGAIKRTDQLGEALAVLARDPAVTIKALDGFGTVAAVDAAHFPKPRRLRAAGQTSLISVAIPLRGQLWSVARLVDMLSDQTTSAKLDVLLIASGLSPEDGATLAKLVESHKAAHKGPRMRIFNVGGHMSEPALANTAVALATGDVVVLADPRCAPAGPDTVQALATWAAGAETLSASPRLLDGAATQLAAGLTLKASPSGEVLLPWTSPALSDLVRRTAAPLPWFFAVNRAAWHAWNGADPRRTGLWTAGLAEAQPGGGREGRHLLIGDAAAIWLEPRPPEALKTPAAVNAPSAESRRAARLVDAGEAVVRALAHPGKVQSSSASFSDPFPSSATQRLLVFADGYGASQQICFVEGLNESRARGSIAVRIVEEAAFGPDGPGFDVDHADALVRSHLEETDPTAVVLSRFAHGRGYDSILHAIAKRPVGLVAHLDDDLFELPVCVGIERYRIARHPWRIHALSRGLADADLVLAATDTLAMRLAGMAGASRVHSIGPGAAGAARPREPTGTSGAEVKIGYMGSASHNHDLEMIAPALNNLLARFDNVSLDLFGSISDQPAADMLRGRVRRLKPISGDYWAFKHALADLGWDIGLAPLRPIPYNLCKTPTKWAEYAEAGIATVASDVEVYRDMIAAQAAVPARPDQWQAALARLISSPRLRADTVASADRLLNERFGWSALEARLLSGLARLPQTRLAAE